MIGALIKLDLTQSMRSFSNIALGLCFFGLFGLLMIISIGGNPEQLRLLISPLIWLAFLLTLLLSASSVWQDLSEADRLEHIWLAGVSPLSLSASRFISQSILLLVPLLCAAPLISLALGQSVQASLQLFKSLLIGAPGLLIYTLLAGAATLRLKRAGLLLILITIPLIIPILIYGISAAQMTDGNNTALYALAGTSLLSIGLGLPAIAALLKTQIEHS